MRIIQSNVIWLNIDGYNCRVILKFLESNASQKCDSKKRKIVGGKLVPTRSRTRDGDFYVSRRGG